MHKRDPVSVLWDAGARRLLSRALQNPGTWQGTRVADPRPGQEAWMKSRGIDWQGPDNASASGGKGLNARDRWTRAFVRSLYYQFAWYSVTGGENWRSEKRGRARHAGALQVEVGRRLPAKGVIRSGRAIRVRYARGGQAKLRAVQNKSDSDRVWTDDGQKASRFSDPALRDW